MKQGKTYTILGFLMLIIMSMSLIFSTLHSHHHIQWDHSGELSDTVSCITKDTSLCPICGYLFNADIDQSVELTYEFEQFDVVEIASVSIIVEEIDISILGRAPPFAV